ncbi:MAG: gas vesicle protein [Nocardioides sp.]|nr:gas vesicle protein [Nocardioides sp.]
MATAKKTSSSDGTAKKSSGSSSDSADKSASKKIASSTPRKRSSAPRAEAPKRKGAQQLAAEATRQLLEMTGKDPEGISGLRRSDDGWIVQVEVLELARIPNTTDVLATYEVEVDSDGELLEYRRVHRYVRGVPGEDGR